jgi:RHS repeat-associated protein
VENAELNQSLPSGDSYLFTYGDWGIANQIANYSAGGNLRSNVTYNYQNALAALGDFPTYTTQTVFDGVLTSAYTYQFTGSSSTPTSVTITDPSTSTTSNSPTKKVVTTFSTGGRTGQVQVMDAGTNAVLRTTAYTWITDTGGINARPSQITNTLENGQQSKVTFTYTTNGNVATQSGYDFNETSLPIRITAYTYAAIGTLHILDRISQALVKDGAGNIVARTDLAYDETSPTAVSGTPNHDDTNFGSTYTTRGNLTSTTTYSNAAAGTGSNKRNMAYDTVGNLRTADLSCCNQKTWSFSSLTQYAFPDSVTKGSSAPTLTTSTTYYPNTYLPNTVTDENSQTVTYTYDSVNRLTTVTRNADGKHFYTTYDDTNALPTIVQSSDVNSAQQKVQTDGVGKPLRADLYNSATLISSTKAYFDELGRAYKRSNPFGPSESEVDTITAFDVLGRPLSVTPPTGGASTYSHSGNSATVTDPAGKTRRSFKDAAGRLVRVDEPGWGNGTPSHGTVPVTGVETIFYKTVCNKTGCNDVITGYDAGNVTITVDGISETVPYGQNDTAYTVANNLANAINNDPVAEVNASTTIVTGSTTNINLTSRAANATTGYVVTTWSASTVAGQTSASFSATGTTMTGGTDPTTPGPATLSSPMSTTYVYDALGNLTTVNQLPQTRTYAFDSLSNLTSAKVPETNQVATTFTYTDFGVVYQRTDPRGIVTTYGYDSLNRLHTIGYSDSTPGVTYNYGTSPAAFNNGAISSITDGSGSTTFTYNNMEQVTQDAKVLGGVTYNIQYVYNAAGELQTLTYPSGRVVTQTYDPIGRLQKIADATNNYMTLTPTTDYTSAGQLKHFAYGNGVVADFGYNDHFEATSIRYWKNGSADLLNLVYSYGTQNNGEIATITDNLDPTRSMTYTYDAWSRLDTAQAGPSATPTWKYSYNYDRFGNRKNQNLIAGTSGYQTLLTIDPNTNHITGTGNVYDAAGNMTGDGNHAYAFDGENRITTVDATATTTAAYTYDRANQRVKKVVKTPSSTTTTVYVFNGSSLIAEYAGGAAAGSPSKEYIGGGGSALASVAAGVVTYYHSDHLSTRVESNSTGGVTRTYGHLPYGEDWYETGSNKWKFTSYERDAESQLNYAMNRYHSGQYGRFMSMDPLWGRLGVPQSLNRYTYAGNDPVNHTDPTGLRENIDCRIIMMITCGGFDGSGVYVDGVELPDFSSLGGDLVEAGAAKDVTTAVAITSTYTETSYLGITTPVQTTGNTMTTSVTLLNLGTTEISHTDVGYLPSFSIGGGGGNGGGGGAKEPFAKQKNAARMMLSNADCAKFLKDTLASLGLAQDLDAFLRTFDATNFMATPRGDQGVGFPTVAHVHDVGRNSTVHIDQPNAQDIVPTMLHEVFHGLTYAFSDFALAKAVNNSSTDASQASENFSEAIDAKCTPKK